MFSKFLRSRRAMAGTAPFDLARLEVAQRGANQTVIRTLASNAYLGDHVSLTRVLGRYKMLLDTQDRGLSQHLMLDGFWEMWVTEAIAAEIRPGMVAADIGANVGYFTMLMAELVGPEGRVHAFDANPFMTDRVAASSELNGFGRTVTVHADALSDTEEDMFRLMVPDGYPSGAHIVRIPAWDPAYPADGDAAAAGLIRARRLDTFAELADVDLLKIDAEGAEQAIWAGMAGILARGRPMSVFMEFAACRYADPGGFLDEIERAGFVIAHVSERHGVQPTDRATLLALPPTLDQMLLLRR